ncbi:transcriptional repressor CTCFL-like [Anopheles stephensi]|uniref:transcriptional repressor CTCFL-like n=1 Tax=Anopheles stephensi TaxID=30069 RepID=UPI001658A290|nr:transcriptional repressor CTCFL-like [Anopheles stephensi]XP_035913840.1 transcriptional repressor CTCFL-like [Anopheles stephensi]XP_035913841.1 transcriptional repressor CTCFL-like [Anopheles stephensi]
MSAKRIKQEPNTKKRVPQEPVAVALKEAKQEKVDIDEMELMTAGLEDDEEGGCYFVDQKGNYYFQASEDAELRAVENGPSDYEPLTGGEQEKTEEEVSYVLIMNDGENKSTIVVNDTDEAGLDPDGKDNEIYDFDDPDYIVPDQEPAAKNKPARAKRGQASTGSMYMCNYCNYTSGKLFLLSRHLKTHSDDRPHKCVVCERGFKTLASLQNHVNTHTGTKPHRCKHCDNCFTTSGELIRHIRYRHTHERPHKCTECDYASVELSKLKRHIRTHTGEKPFQCPHCTYASPDKFKLTRHMRIHTGEKPYSCDVCFARFTQSNSLKAHKMIHQVGNKPVFQCKLCPTTCGRKTDLRIHVQNLHTADKPIKCKRCDNTFPDRYSYKIHAKTHEGEKCYRCDYCPYASISMRHLESHLLLHTDQKPYKCDQCAQTFRQKQLLKRHINYYHNPDYVAPTPKAKTHSCPSCTRSFRHKGNLIRHMALHDPESTMSKELEALREGRQKKVQITFEDELTYKGEEEEYEGEEDEDEEEEGEDEEEEEEEEEDEGQAEDENEEEEDETGMPMETSDMVTVEDEDGQYVVLEVIQLQDKDSKAADSKAPKKRASKRKATATATATPTATAQPSSSSKTATTTGTTVATPTTSRVTRSVKKEPIELVSPQDHHTLDMDGISLVMVEEDGEDGAQQIVIERESGGQSGDEFILSTEDSIDLQHTEMLMSSLQSAKRSRFDVTISQDELEKNMSNCFGFDDDDDEVLDTKATITLLN